MEAVKDRPVDETIKKATLPSPLPHSPSSSANTVSHYGAARDMLNNFIEKIFLMVLQERTANLLQQWCLRKKG
jgi:adenine-specific DNA methylase